MDKQRHTSTCWLKRECSKKSIGSWSKMKHTDLEQRPIKWVN